MENSLVAYCASCSVQLGREDRYAVALRNAQTHATVTGHPVDIVDCVTWSAVDKVFGEPSLPLWE